MDKNYRKCQRMFLGYFLKPLNDHFFIKTSIINTLKFKIFYFKEKSHLLNPSKNLVNTRWQDPKIIEELIDVRW